MATPSPPKPWERAGAGTGATSTALSSSTSAAAPTSASVPGSGTTAADSSDLPALPDRPSSLNSVVNRTASNYSPYSSANRFGSSPYGGMGSYGSAYSSPYSRLGGMGGGMYGGGAMGGYGGMGGYGMGGYGGMGGMGGYGGMQGGMPGDPNDPNSLTNSFSQNTQATFQIIESIVGAFGGFAQMLESTYMATHSSFFAMVSVAEQFGNLRNTLGSVLGIFTLLRWARTLLAKLTGRPPPASAGDLTPGHFAAFEGRVAPDGSPAGPPRPSKKPFLVFLLAVFGLPYLMGKLIRALARSQEEEQEQQRRTGVGPDGQPIPLPEQQQLDPSKLDFCRVLYDFNPEAGVRGVDLEVKKGDLVAVLSKSDPMGNPSDWWRCRARDGRMGYLPSPYLEAVVRRDPKAITSGSQQGSRTQSLTASSAPGGGSRTATGLAGKPGDKPPVVSGKPSDLTADSFQKSQFYS